MKKFILFYKGPATPADAPHAEWPIWFKGLGDHLVSVGSPMQEGFALGHDGTTSNRSTPLNGYSIIQADDRSQAIQLTRNHPYLSLGSGYRVEIFELPGA